MRSAKWRDIAPEVIARQAVRVLHTRRVIVTTSGPQVSAFEEAVGASVSAP
jgi:hypothetical protein